MSTIAIRAEGLSKRYRIEQGERYYTLRDVLASTLVTPLHLWRNRRRKTEGGSPVFSLQSPISGQRSAVNGRNNYLWALQGVSFEVKQGEVVGIIGRNGAGKSTLLKILSRITKPTSGFAEVYGRVGSLLEVGTGFHFELTGRENIYLNGAILGMRKAEITRKFDEIVAFAEVEKFIDTAVKHYSSGMYMRLAFAVAAHLEPEILLVDEVLAVGDTAFQKKCLGKMGDVAKEGRTVIFVSHQMNQIRRLCEKAIWIEAGQIRAQDNASRVVSLYEAAALDSKNGSAGENGCFVKWEVMNQGYVVKEGAQPITFRVVAHLRSPVSNGHLGIAILNDANLVVAGWAFESLSFESGARELLVEVPSLPLRPGAYSLRCALFNRGNNLTGGDLVEYWHAVPQLLVDAPPLAHPQDAWAGVLNLPANLTVRDITHETA
jgi:lipopolysaccharide transport system ATP-binding protein